MKDKSNYIWNDNTNTNKTYPFVINAAEEYYVGETLVDSNSIRIIGGIADNSNFRTDNTWNGSANNYDSTPKPSSAFQALTDNNNTVAYYDVENEQPPLIIFEPNGFYLRENFVWGYQARYTRNGEWVYGDSFNTSKPPLRKIGIHDKTAENIVGICEEVASQSIASSASGSNTNVKLYKITDSDAITYCSWYITFDNSGYNKGPFQCSIGIPIANITYKQYYNAANSTSATNKDICTKKCAVIDFTGNTSYKVNNDLVRFRNKDNKYILAFVKISKDVDAVYKAKVEDPVSAGGGGWSGYGTPVNGGWGSYAFYLYFGNQNKNTHGILNTYYPCCYMINSCWTSVASTEPGGSSIGHSYQSRYTPAGNGNSGTTAGFYNSRLGRVNPIYPTTWDSTNQTDEIAKMKNADGTDTTTTLNCQKDMPFYNKPDEGEWYTVYISGEGEATSRTTDTGSVGPNATTYTSSDSYSDSIHYNLKSNNRFNTDVLRYTKTTQEEINKYISKRTFDTKAFYMPNNPNTITFRIGVPSGSAISAADAKVSKSKSAFISEGFTFNDTTQKYTQPDNSSYYITIPDNETWVNTKTGKTFYPGDRLNYVKYSGLSFELK